MTCKRRRWDAEDFEHFGRLVRASPATDRRFVESMAERGTELRRAHRRLEGDHCAECRSAARALRNAYHIIRRLLGVPSRVVR